MTEADKLHMKELERQWLRNNFKDEYETVYDFGCGRFNAKEQIKYKKFFPIDKIKIDDDTLVHDLEYPVKLLLKADLILCNNMLEHVWDYEMVIRNIYDNLKKDGIVSIRMPYIFEYHGNNQTPDYWRFTPEGMRKLLEHNYFEIIKMEVVKYKNCQIVAVIAKKNVE